MRASLGSPPEDEHSEGRWLVASLDLLLPYPPLPFLSPEIGSQWAWGEPLVSSQLWFTSILLLITFPFH